MNESTPTAPEADPLAAQAHVIVEHVNEDHADVLLLVAPREIGGHPDAEAAVAVGLDSRGIDLTIPPDDTRVPRLPRTRARSRRSADADVAARRTRPGPQWIGSPHRARTPSGRARRDPDLHHAGHGRRAARSQLVQVTCGGGDLRTFAELGPDQFVYVLAPPAGRSGPTDHASFSWSRTKRCRMPSVRSGRITRCDVGDPTSPSLSSS